MTEAVGSERWEIEEANVVSECRVGHQQLPAIVCPPSIPVLQAGAQPAAVSRYCPASQLHPEVFPDGECANAGSGVGWGERLCSGSVSADGGLKCSCCCPALGCRLLCMLISNGEDTELLHETVKYPDVGIYPKLACIWKNDTELSVWISVHKGKNRSCTCETTAVCNVHL